jgi:hypothetical protein
VYQKQFSKWSVNTAVRPAGAQLASLLPIGRVGTALVAGEELIADGASSLFSSIDGKIANQMARRVWTNELIHEVVNNPFPMRIAKNRATGNVRRHFIPSRVIIL